MWVGWIALGCLLSFSEDTAQRELSGLLRWFGEVWLPCVYYELILVVAYPANDEKPPSCLHAFLGSAPLRWLANISLAVYVVHEILIGYMILAAYGPLPHGANMGNPAAYLMPRWGSAATLPLSIFLGQHITAPECSRSSRTTAHSTHLAAVDCSSPLAHNVRQAGCSPSSLRSR
jgi:peptidoglycan/LPS O-acetylase OafA/YrhL